MLGAAAKQTETSQTLMKTPIAAFVFAMASAASMSAAVTITVSNFTPNGTASGGSGSGVGAFTLAINGGSPTNISTITYPTATDRGIPVTTYTISNIDLTSVGGTASESFTFTVAYTATTDGTTPGVPRFNGFGNVSVGDITVADGDDNQVDGTETLTATIHLTSSTFGGLSLVGFTSVRAGGVSDGETAVFNHAGGTADITFANREPSISGNFATLIPNSPTDEMNFEGFRADFTAVPEPGSISLLGLGALALLRRRRIA